MSSGPRTRSVSARNAEPKREEAKPKPPPPSPLVIQVAAASSNGSQRRHTPSTSKYKDKFHQLREKYDRVMVVHNAARRDLHNAQQRMRYIQDEIDLLLEVMLEDPATFPHPPPAPPAPPGREYSISQRSRRRPRLLQQPSHQPYPLPQHEAPAPGPPPAPAPAPGPPSQLQISPPAPPPPLPQPNSHHHHHHHHHQSQSHQPTIYRHPPHIPPPDEQGPIPTLRPVSQVQVPPSAMNSLASSESTFPVTPMVNGSNGGGEVRANGRGAGPMTNGEEVQVRERTPPGAGFYRWTLNAP